MDPIFFPGPDDLRAWFEANHASATELWVGYWRKATGRSSLTWALSVDEALCVGWIDGVRRSVDDERYANRFTPRRAGSRWSAVNVRRARELIAEGRMQPAGLAAFERRIESGYSHERDAARLAAPLEARFRTHADAWAFWEAQPAGYRRQRTWWVVSAKREETRERRLDALVAACARGERLR